MTQKTQSQRILKEMAHLMSHGKVGVQSMRGMTVGRFTMLNSKFGKVEHLIPHNDKLLVWMSIHLTRGVVVEYGIELTNNNK